jgi:hypothetical protein
MIAFLFGMILVVGDHGGSYPPTLTAPPAPAAAASAVALPTHRFTAPPPPPPAIPLQPPDPAARIELEP